MNRQLFAALGLAMIAACAGLATYIWLQTNAGDIAQRRVTFSLTDAEGQVRHASEWDGQWQVINFWAPWCEPCRAEIPLLIALQEKHAADDLQVLGPALDKPEAVKAFATKYGINYPVLTGLTAVMDLQEAYGDTRLPYTVLLNPEGEVVFSHAGELSAEIMEAQISARISPK